MTTEKMTIHKALAELKIIDDRILKAIGGGTFCVANKHSNGKIRGVGIKDFEDSMRADYNKASDLIARRNAIKRGVVLSNAVTTVTVGKDTYTVAEAIEMKNHGVEFKEALYSTMLNQYQKAQSEILKNNGDSLNEKAESYVIGIYGNREGKTDTDDFKKAKQDFIDSNSYELVDPLKIKEKLDSLEKEISEFKAEIDATLSTSNALTEIEITY
jgi:hypothetical protein